MKRTTSLYNIQYKYRKAPDECGVKIVHMIVLRPANLIFDKIL